VLEESAAGAVSLGGSNGNNVLSVSNNTIVRNNLGDGLVATGLTAATLTNVDVLDNGGDAIRLTFGNGGLSCSSLSAAGNRNNGLGIAGSLSGNPRLSPCGLPYVNNGLILQREKTLTLTAGAIMKMPARADLTLPGRGALVAQGVVNNPVVITSLKDDAHGGDTNGDGTSSGGRGDWGGLRLQGGYYNGVVSVTLTHTLVRYGGFGGAAMIEGTGDGYVTLTLDRSTVERSGAGAIALGGSNGNNILSVTGSSIRINAGDGIAVRNISPGTSTVTASNIHDNDDFGIRNITPAVVVSAENNWWGHPSGPPPSGSGDEVSAGVDFDPWLTSPAP
jgi:hypothetical protein